MKTTTVSRWRRLAAACAAAVAIGAAGPALAQFPAAQAGAKAAPAAVTPQAAKPKPAEPTTATPQAAKPQPKPAKPQPAKATPAKATPAKPKKPKKPPKIFVSADGGGGFASAGFTSEAAYSLYGENATIVATFPDASGAAVAVRGAVRVWRRLALGASVTGFWSTPPAKVTASLPHPFYFNRPRRVEGAASGLGRDETMIAIEGSWMVRLNARTDVQVFGGPAFFSVRAGVPATVQFTESYPFDAAAFTGVETARVSGSAAGFTVGGDVSYMFTRSIGVGGHVRFSRAAASLTPPGGQATTVDLGGVQAGGGLRVRF